jgi:hypothetical protein
MSLLPWFTWLATLSALTGSRLSARAADVNRRTRQMVSNKLKPSAVKVTLKVLCFGPAAGLSLSNPSTNVARSAAGFWCIRRSSSHSVLLRLNACVLHDLLLEAKIDLDRPGTSNCLDDQERRGDWEKTYAASNTIYGTRQNNVLFSVLAQFFEPEAINDRLILVETLSFTTSPDDMMKALTRIIADRSDGALFFGNYHMMDYELMGGDARVAIAAESAKLGKKAFLPPVVPFDSRQWPMRITPGPGPASLADLP